ncbi:MAG: aminotransferase class I/II-fold pyridoxal phosphate-dependent enzyme [Pseudomonadota bacterium]
MQFPARYADLPEYAFPRLRRLLSDHAPGGAEIAMSLGEPQHAVPPFVGPIMLEHQEKLSKYPPNESIPELREAISDWLGFRYAVGLDYRDPETQIFPLNGTREGLYAACVSLCPEQKNGNRPAVLLPNPFYQCYTVAAVTAGAEPVYLPCTAETGHLPDFSNLSKDLLDRTAIAYICSPANPQGVCADSTYWRTLLELAERHDFRVFADECYSEIYRDQPPVGALQVASEIGADPERLVCFHSLSKRSNLAGLRSGFAVTGPENRNRMLQMRSYVGAPLPIPAQHAATACWQDEDHVIANRKLYHQKYTIADQVLGNAPGYMSPEAGFFVWLNIGNGEDAALKLWKEAGVRALPGSYLSRPISAELGGGDPGERYLRLALVAPAEDVQRGLEAVREVLL